MNSNRHRPWFVWLIVASVVFVCGCSSPAPKTPKTAAVHMFNEYSEEGVVVVALGAMGAATLGESELPDTVVVQMGILNAAVQSGPVLLMVPRYIEYNRLRKHCEKFSHICTALDNGNLRIVEVYHEGPWVRDYGPQFGQTVNGLPIVYDASYHDRRNANIASRAQRARFDTERRQIIEKLERIRDMIERYESFAADSAYFRERLQSVKAEEEELTKRLSLLREKVDAYSDESYEKRVFDDESTLDFVQTALQSPQFRIKKTNLFVEGGNLMRLPGGRCATTSALISANDGHDGQLQKVLTEDYGCHEMIYLAALPGQNIIKHIDMFLLPVDGKSVALAQFDLKKAPLAKDFVNVDAEIQELAIAASVAMDRNEAVLKKSGLEVHRVPAPLPRKGENGIYFPTVLNALVRMDAKGVRHVIMPRYDGYQEEVQAIAVKKLEEVFPKGTSFYKVEATAAAEGQGAVHCLSLVIPTNVSIFGDSRSNKQVSDYRTTLATLREKEERTTKKLEGRWVQTSNDKNACSFRNGQGYCFVDGNFKFFSYSLLGGGAQLRMLKRDDEEIFDLDWTSKGQLRLAPQKGARMVFDRRELPTRSADGSDDSDE